MNDAFLIVFFAKLLARMVKDQGGTAIARLIADRVREDFERDHSSIAQPLQEALDECKLTLTPKGN